MLRVLYTAGPGNAFDTFSKWKAEERDLTVSHVAYSRQMLDVCAKHHAAALVTCTNEHGEEQKHGDISIVRRIDPTRNKSGFAYHLGVYQKARQTIKDALEFKADIVVVAEDTNPAYYAPLRRRGVQIVQSLHTSLWRAGSPQSFKRRLKFAGFRQAYADNKTIVLSASDTVSSQVEEISGSTKTPILEFLPLYYPEHYADISPAQDDSERLEILFVSRIEENKGALDLIAIAGKLVSKGVAFRFHICGVGGALDAMQQLVIEQQLSRYFQFHGWCDRDDLRRVMAQCHISIVPTKASITEGFNHVVVESVLSGLPVVASDSCPAVRYVGDAVKIVEADDLEAYASAIYDLGHDREKLNHYREACTVAGRPFSDEAYSFASAIDEIFAARQEKRQVVQRRISPSDLT